VSYKSIEILVSLINILDILSVYCKIQKLIPSWLLNYAEGAAHVIGQFLLCAVMRCLCALLHGIPPSPLLGTVFCLALH
jgi:hypothetical protein